VVWVRAGRERVVAGRAERSTRHVPQQLLPALHPRRRRLCAAGASRSALSHRRRGLECARD
jgi:hypothetical protein